jgi:carboxylesterase
MYTKNILPKASRKSTRRFVMGVGIILAILLLIVLLLFFPLDTRDLASDPHPALDYDDALQGFDLLEDRVLPGMNPDCRPRLLEHGRATEKVIAFIHGYTSCPKQFASLGEAFFDLGYNVLILPLPHHGLADRMTAEHAQLTAEELVAYTDQIVDITQGLGEDVTVVGFSLGGSVAAWAAQTRSDVDFVVLIAPGFGLQPIPADLTLPAIRLAMLLPNFYRWWEPENKAAGGLPHAYPRIATRALAQMLRLGYAVRDRARQAPPQAGAILIVTNENEPSVQNGLTERLAQAWIAHGAEVSLHEFPKELNLPHDLIDPEHPYGHPEIVYPILIPLLQR